MADYINRKNVITKLQRYLMPNVIDGDVSVETAERHFLNLLQEEPTGDVVKVEKIEQARDEILTRMNDLMNEYMRHGSGADYFAGKSESMENAIRLVRAVFTHLIDESKEEGEE